jgi:hypothetical protein
MKKGFTLIEVLMYVGLFTLLVGTLLGIAYLTIDSTDKINKKIVLQQEADFILRKIDWALSGAESVTVGPKPSNMSVTRFSNPNTVIFSQNGNFVDINSGLGQMDLNSSNTVVSNLTFIKIQTGSAPTEIEVNFNLANVISPSDSQNFQLTKYLEQ